MFHGEKKGIKDPRCLPYVLLILLLYLVTPPIIFATNLLPDASFFAEEKEVIKNYFEIRGLNITFEILPLQSTVDLQKSHNIKELSQRKRGVRNQLLQLAQAFRDSKTDEIPSLLYLENYGLVINANIWRNSPLRDWASCGAAGSTDIERRMMALRQDCTGQPGSSFAAEKKKSGQPVERPPALTSKSSLPPSPPAAVKSQQIGAGLGIPSASSNQSKSASDRSRDLASPSAAPGGKGASGSVSLPADIGIGFGVTSAAPGLSKSKNAAEETEPVALAAEASRSYHFDRRREQMPEKSMAEATEALFTGGDPVQAKQILSEEEALSKTAGDGSGLIIADVSSPETPVVPGQMITIRVRVRNTLESGSPAVFELGVWDYHRDNATVTRRKGLHLAPAATQTFTLKFPAPRAEMFGGYVYLDPLFDSRSEYPTNVIHIDIRWDDETMTDAEIVAMFRDRIPDMRYQLADHDADRWVALYRQLGNEAIFEFQQHVMDEIRELEERQRIAYLNDPDFINDVENTLAAEENTRRLAEYDMQHAWAVKQGDANGIDLISILEDHVFIDENARVRGNLQAARGAMLDAIRRKNEQTTSVDRLLMDYGDTSGMTRTYAQTSAVMTPVLAASRFADMNQGLLTHMNDRELQKLMAEYKDLVGQYRKADTHPLHFQKDLETLRTRFAFADKRLGHALTGRAKDVYQAYRDQVSTQLAKMDAVIEKAREFQKKADLYLRRSRGIRLASKGLEKMGDAWDWYDLYEKTHARIRAGEDGWASFGKEVGVFKLKSLIGKVPVVSAADAIMTASGQALYHSDQEMWDELGIDPRQYNASTLVDMGGGLSFAYLEDRMAAAGARNERFRMTPADREIAENRLRLLEDRIQGTVDPEQLKRLVQARKMVREALREGM